jgi:hypothetical protein
MGYTLKTCRAASTCTLVPEFPVTRTQTTHDPAIGGDLPGRKPLCAYRE